MVRITQSLLASRVLYNLQNNLERMALLQEQLSTGRRLNTPSDDPVDFPRDLSLRNQIAVNRRYRSNIEQAKTQLELTETTLDSVTNLIQRARELTVQAGNSTNLETRAAINQEVGEILQQLIDLGNTSYGGKYIFGGSNTDEKPFVYEDGAVKYYGNDETVKALIGQSIAVGMNLTGNETFIQQPNIVTSAYSVSDTSKPIIDILAEINPYFSETPPVSSELGSGTASASPNPDNYADPSAKNLATFSIYGTEITVDITVDSLDDLVERINTVSPDVAASLTSDGRLQITSTRSDALDLQDGASNPGFPPQATFGSNILSALGMHSQIQDRRDLDNGYPSTNPLAAPGDPRSYVKVTSDVLLFEGSEVGPDNDPSIPFPDNLAITDLQASTISNLEAIRIVIDGETIDIDLSALTQGYDNPTDLDPADVNADNVRGSSMQDLLDLINNDPRLQGRAVAYIDDDGSGIGIMATSSTDEFYVENVSKIFGRDITTQLTTTAGPPVTRTYTRVGPVTEDTKLTDLPGALIDATENSLGIRQDSTPSNPTNNGKISIINGDKAKGIDLADAVTVGDVLRAINDSDAGVKASINPSGTGLTLERIDNSTGELSIQDMSTGTIARDLGFVGSLPPKRVVSDAAIPTPPANTLNSVGITSGTFQFQIHDQQGRVLGDYSIQVDDTLTFEEFAEQLDGLDGYSGSSEGLFSVNVVNDRFVIQSNFNGHTIFIDPDANDSVADPTNSNLVETLDLDAPTLVTETEVNTASPAIFPVIVNQDTASILGLEGSGTVDEVEEHNIFKTLQDLQAALNSDDNEGITNALADIDIDLDIILNSRTVVGARINRLDATTLRLEDSEVFQRQQLSLLEDADLAALITDLTTQENAFNAALAASSRVIQPSLLDYLR